MGFISKFKNFLINKFLKATSDNYNRSWYEPRMNIDYSAYKDDRLPKLMISVNPDTNRDLFSYEVPIKRSYDLWETCCGIKISAKDKMLIFKSTSSTTYVEDIGLWYGNRAKDIILLQGYDERTNHIISIGFNAANYYSGPGISIGYYAKTWNSSISIGHRDVRSRAKGNGCYITGFCDGTFYETFSINVGTDSLCNEYMAIGYKTAHISVSSNGTHNYELHYNNLIVEKNKRRFIKAVIAAFDGKDPTIFVVKKMYFDVYFQYTDDSNYNLNSTKIKEEILHSSNNIDVDISFSVKINYYWPLYDYVTGIVKITTNGLSYPTKVYAIPLFFGFVYNM